MPRKLNHRWSDEHRKKLAPRVIRFSIAGRWSTEDMGEFCLALDDLYMLLDALETTMLRDSSGARGKFKKDLKYHSEWLRECNPGVPFLRIIKIRYGSPGFQDIAGAGVIVGHIKDFVLGIIDNVSNRKKRRLENKQLEIENARKFLELADDYNLTDEETMGLINAINERQRKISRLVAERKVISVRDAGRLSIRKYFSTKEKQ